MNKIRSIPIPLPMTSALLIAMYRDVFVNFRDVLHHPETNKKKRKLIHLQTESQTFT